MGDARAIAVTGWTKGEITAIVAAARRAPSVCRGEPWVLEFHDRYAALFERFDGLGRWHDPLGRNRLLSCGAALTHVRLAIRRLGWASELVLFPNPLRPDEVVRVLATRRSVPTDDELAGYRAIRQRRAFRGRFGPEPVPDLILRALLQAPNVPGVQLEVAPQDVAESVGRSFIVSTAGDGRSDHLLAGAAVAEIWLAATRAGFAGALTVDLDVLRAGPPGMAGFPQALLRVGIPAGSGRSVAWQETSDASSPAGAGEVAEDFV